MSAKQETHNQLHMALIRAIDLYQASTFGTNEHDQLKDVIESLWIYLELYDTAKPSSMYPEFAGGLNDVLRDTNL